MTMFGPYWMVSLSIAFTIFVLLIYLIYRFIWPKKELSHFQIVTIASLLPVVSILRPGVYESGDFTIHIYEAMSFFDNLYQGNLIPRWGGELNATYGYPVFLFAYPLPNYLISLPHFIGISFIASLKMFLILSFIGSGIAMFYFMKRYAGKTAGVVSAIFYLYAPYHLIDLHFRVAIGEILAFVFMPINLLLTYMFFQEHKFIFFILNAICLSCLILSHQAISLSFFPFLLIMSAVFCAQLKRKINDYLKYLLSLGIGILLTAYYLIPVLLEKQFTTHGIFPNNIHFNHILEFIYSPWRFGFLFQGPIGQLSLIVGYTQLAIVLLGIYLLLKQKIHDTHRFIVFLLIVLFLLLFSLMQSFSEPLWHLVPLVNNFQFSYRLLALIALVISILAGLVSLTLSRKMIVIICLITMFYTILNWGNRRVIPEINDATLRANLAKSTIEGEGNSQSVPLWIKSKIPWTKDTPKHHLEVVSGSAVIHNIERQNEEHTYKVNSFEPVQLKENTVYFPGWTLYLNGEKKNIDTSLLEEDGVIRTPIPAGNHRLEFTFENTLLRTMGEIVSLSTLIITLLSLGVKLPKR